MMKLFKILMALAIFAAIGTTTVNAQTKEKEYKCTSACTKDKHQFAHGEKGHTCGAACKKTVTKKP